MKIFKNTILLFAIAFMALATNSCANMICVEGSGMVTENERMTAVFDEIEIESAANVFIKQGSTNYIRVDTDGNLQQFVETRIEDNTLYISTTEAICPTKLNVYVTFTSLNEIEKKGSGNLWAKGKITLTDFSLDSDGSGKTEFESLIAPKISLDLNGSGKILVGELSADNLSLEVNGSGDIKVGESNAPIQNLSCEIEGSGNIDVLGIITKNAKIEISGSGDVKLHVEDNLSAEITGSGDVHYRGKPLLVVETEGSGSVYRLDK